MTTTPQQEQAKAAFLDRLYACSGRTNGLYTGLWQEFQQDLARYAREVWAAGGVIVYATKEEADALEILGVGYYVP